MRARAMDKWLGRLLVLVSCWLAGCGGSGSDVVAGVGSGGSGVASGSVSGFGSVIIDGVEYDDASAAHLVEDGNGNWVNADVKLGQRVRLVYSGSQVAQRVEVQAQLRGSVSSAVDGSGRLQVLGQTVRLVSSSSDASLSSLTVLDGYTASGAIAAGDAVEVHGAWSYDSTLARYVLVATRLEKLASTPDPVLLGGVVYSTGSAGVRLNSADGTLLRLPEGSSVSAGDALRVWVARSALGSSPVVVSRLAGSGTTAAELASFSTVTLSGLPSNYDPVARTVQIQGVTLSLPAGLSVDAAALAAGQFVSVTLSPSGSTLVAQALSTRRGDGDGGSGKDLGRTITLKGVVRGVDWSASPVSFTLRGTSVQAAQSTLAAACLTVGSNVDVAVQVTGTLAVGSSVVVASAVSCTASPVAVSGEVLEYQGQLSQINLDARTLMLQLTRGAGLIQARWDERTYFDKRPASLPIGQKVEVEGVFDQGSALLRLTRVRQVD